MEPKISIIMPVCNVEKYLAACLDSAIEQSFHDIEIICINDGSKDSSLDILREYARKDDRIIIIDKANAGYGAAMNDGLKKARGEYIGILESDDRVCADAWSALYDLAKDNDLDLVRGNYFQFKGGQATYFDANRKVDCACPDSLEVPPFDTVIRPLDYPRCFWINPSIWTGLFRRDFLEKYNIWFNETPGASYQDAGFAFKTWAMADRAMVTDVPVIYYTMDNESSSSNSRAKVYAVCDEMAECERYLAEQQADKALNKILSAIRYKTYAWNQKRVADDFKEGFNEKMWEELRADFEAGYCDADNFRRSEVELIERNVRGTVAVSVIIPVCNAADYLRECLDSVLKQTLTSFEAICVNDGSTDGSLRILHEYADRDERIVVIDLPHENAGRARNEGLARARGTYLAFLDADDYFGSKMLARMVELADRNDLDVAMCRAKQYHDVRKTKSLHENPTLDQLQPNHLYSADDLWGYAFRYAIGWPWDKLFRRSYIEQHELLFQEVSTTNDAYFVYSALALAKRIMFINDRLVVHRVDNVRSIEHSRDNAWQNLFLAIDAIKQRLESEGIYSAAERDFVNWVADMCVWNILSLKSGREGFFNYVKDTYAHQLAVTDADYFYYEDYQWQFRIWDSCDYDLAQSIFDLKKELKNKDRELRVAKKTAREAKKKLECVKSSHSYKLGRTLTAPVRSIRRKNR